MSCCDEVFDDVATEKPGTAQDQYVHGTMRSPALTRIVQNESEAEAHAPCNGRNAMAKGGAVVSFLARTWQNVGRQYEHVALIGREHVYAGLGAWFLLGQHDFTAAELRAGAAQIKRRL